MKILITGSTGMLGSECKEVFGEKHEVISPEKSMMDIVSWDGIIETLQKVKPDVVLNCAGFTDVDACEKDPEGAHKINVEGPRNLAQCCARFECKLVHISSDYVFDGQKMPPQPYFEDDVLDPVSTYGLSKMESEIAVRENSPNYLIVRASWLYSLRGKDFIKFILNGSMKKKPDLLRIVSDQYVSPTWSHRLAVQIKTLLENGAVGTYHATAEGYCTPFEYAEHIVKKLGIKANLEPCSLKDLKRKARRPKNCILENRLLKKQGISIMVDWKEDLDVFLDTFGAAMMKGGAAKKA